MPADLVATKRDGHVLIITMQRDTKRNAVDRAMADQLDVAFNELEDDSALWAGVLAGSSVAFSAGSDLKSEGDYYTERGGEYAIIRRQRRKPLIAAVEAMALGGGMEIALACDLVIASETATFGLPEVKRGLIPACAGLFRGPRALPLNIATELILTGDSISAQRAAELGFANQVVPTGTALEAAKALADKICQNGPVAVQLALEAIRASVATNDELGWTLTEKARTAVYASEDRTEGVSAFFEKRAPQWTGR
ncbi:enoyl-CoA hydratase/carnithine racemase [Antricoccus suffuscus]|uniref:Enoyl-CoA hydratase/carnithine racemase n=1 Tax=Antricoccus suffuscus TaxID=1629062 RepID=A0A2T0ZYT5_9ACTN|nr:enoyl-CoA hydratase-related protein [Antricoccus suffuscus]PRZ41506.1 enoyl-CoA hydratase/carnithine racemase [Antricoccus suffuscus]